MQRPVRRGSVIPRGPVRPICMILGLDLNPFCPMSSDLPDVRYTAPEVDNTGTTAAPEAEFQKKSIKCSEFTSNVPVYTFMIILTLFPLLAFFVMYWFEIALAAKFSVAIIFLAIHFWYMKNIAGRFMIGMRWWSGSDAEGETRWHFEARPQKVHRKSESVTFWLCLIVPFLLFLGMALLDLFTILTSGFDILTSGSGVVLLGINLFGYIKCVSRSKASRGGLKGVIRDTATERGKEAIRENPELVLKAANQAAAAAVAAPRPAPAPAPAEGSDSVW
eukprot:gnl/Chilomastix_cuspidata/840.p1 GENE.gnl/Chilomastix_cuspidata/840~~gnl/Chilomastix_cuspidata/840.p1  ORF type:complete len:277 (+),score=94.94 gnl/Chilomastix_cuspidata/840:201-1031(+)